MSNRVVKLDETQFHRYVTPKSPCWRRTDVESTLKNAMTFEKFPRQRFRIQHVVKSFLATCAAVVLGSGHLIITVLSSMDVVVFH
jgi:hypothetical protein